MLTMSALLCKSEMNYIFFTDDLTRCCYLQRCRDNILRICVKITQTLGNMRKIAIAFRPESYYNMYCLVHKSQLFLWEEGFTGLHGSSC